MKRIVLASMLLLTGIGGASAQAAPLPKQGPGACPANYQQSGGFCVPFSRQARVCIERRGGSCPANYVQSGGYCCQVAG